ncbi:MAG TPA: penicillin-binding protein [Clostridiales bacterium]|jgi:penicillin-binding protein 2|nr:penicillin-binding protein [Clostridiales bacterium]
MRVKTIRVTVIILFLAIILSVYATALYELQIIKGEDYYDESLNSIVTTSTVEAARGLILDRYGNVLVSNRTSYNVTIDHTLLTNSGEPNAILLRLVEISRARGIRYTDTLPISFTAPFTYIDNMTETQSYRLDYYTDFFDFEQTPTAEELMEFFKEHYKIEDGYSDTEARLIAGLRYELEIRLIMYAPKYIFTEDVDIDFITVVMEQNLAGVKVEAVSTRQYHTPYAAHLLGRVGQMSSEEYETYSKQGYSMNALVGKDGVEAAFESYLHGTDGIQTTTVTSTGAVKNVIYSEPPLPGKTVVLTLDIGLQGAAENILAERIAALNEARGEKEEKIPGGAVVAVDIKGGDLLAAASYPTFDLSKFNEIYDELLSDPTLPLYNRALQGLYSPGSTFKIVTAVAALREGILTPSDRIYDRGRFTKYDSYQPTCWIHPGSHGWVNTAEALRDSCNYYFFELGDRLGIDRLSACAAQFGLGSATGIELYEETGVLATREYKESRGDEPWFVGDTLQASIGQSFNLFTPLQLAEYTATIANNGTRLATHILKAVKSPDFSQTLYTSQPKVLSVVEADKEIFDAVQLGMLYVTTQGTPSMVFKDLGVSAAAKTGTAQLGEDLANNAIFICYAPYENPEIAVAVVVEKGGSGNAIASIAKDVLKYYFDTRAARQKIDSENVLVS